MRAPLVSAIIATYNYEPFLPQTLESALGQDYPAESLEVVVIDDGSTDRTPEILADFSARYPGRVRAFRQQNAGYVAATNRAFAEARGDYWALLDADDLWLPEKTKLQVELFERDPEVGAVYGDLSVIDSSGAVLRPSYWTHAALQPLRGPGALVSLVGRNNVATASSIMVRASLRNHFAPIPLRVPYVDWWLVLQISGVASLDFLLDPCALYRFHGGNLTMHAEGEKLVGELIKSSMTRRQALIHGAVGRLPESALAPVWAAVERDLISAVHVAKSGYLELPRPTEGERASARRLAEHALSLQRRGRPGEALRCWLVAAALDPFASDARTSIEALGELIADGYLPLADPLDGARSLTLLVEIDSLREDPELIAEFDRAFGPHDDATLVIYAPGCDSARLEHELRRLYARVGVEPERGADVVALPDPERALDWERLAAAADLVGSGADAAELLRARYETVAPLLAGAGALEQVGSTSAAPSLAGTGSST